jgi:hypothetical protein
MRHNHYKIKIGYVHFTVITEQTDDKTDNELSTYIGQSSDTIKGCDLPQSITDQLEDEIIKSLNLPG